MQISMSRRQPLGDRELNSIDGILENAQEALQAAGQQISELGNALGLGIEARCPGMLPPSGKPLPPCYPADPHTSRSDSSNSQRSAASGVCGAMASTLATDSIRIPAKVAQYIIHSGDTSSEEDNDKEEAKSRPDSDEDDDVFEMGSEVRNEFYDSDIRSAAESTD